MKQRFRILNPKGSSCLVKRVTTVTKVVASPGAISDLSEVEETGEKEYGEEYFQTKTGIMDVIFEEWDGL